MNEIDQQTIYNLSDAFKVDEDLIQSIWTESRGNLEETLAILQTIAGNPNSKKPSPQKSNRSRSHTEDSLSIMSDMNEEEFSNPDEKFALELLKEEYKRERNLRRQQEEDAKLALSLNKKNGRQAQNVFQKNQNPNFSNPVQDETFQALENLLHTKGVLKKKVRVIIEEEDKSCVVCMNNERNAVFVPCAHKCCCFKCAADILNIKKVCPLCWVNLEGAIKCKVTD